MIIHPLAAALLSIAMSVSAQFLLKAGVSAVNSTAAAHSDGMSALIAALGRPQVLAGFVLYGLGAVVWLSVLANYDVSKAYPLVGLGFVLTALVGIAMGEQVGCVRVLGILLICAGVALVGRS